MNLSYILLALTGLICLFTKNRNLMLLSLLITTISAFSQGIVNLVGIITLLFFHMICNIYFSYEALNKYWKWVLFVTIVALLAGYMFHLIPGFSNALVIEKVHVSPTSSLFSMYLNFDKTISALILYVAAKLFIVEKLVDKKSLQQSLYTFLLCVGVILIPALLSGYIKFDPKVPDILQLFHLKKILVYSVEIPEILFPLLLPQIIDY